MLWAQLVDDNGAPLSGVTASLTYTDESAIIAVDIGDPLEGDNIELPSSTAGWLRLPPIARFGSYRLILTRGSQRAVCTIDLMNEKPIRLTPPWNTP
jgi:hypothetical protein